ncbi:MAG: hypothetical protein NPINA01_03850 [Nitrospinaceae bacterium]|nr:MAG: hypothetical protein NPINA01_03850 [Nitrospinaceae bacterium]
MSGPPLAQIDSESGAEVEDNFLSGLREDFAELHSDQEDKPVEEEKNLDDYLDTLLADESDPSPVKTVDKSVEPPDQEPSSFEMPSEEELDHLFDSIITQEIQSDNPEEQPAPSLSEADPEEENLDALLDEIINDIDSEEETEPPDKSEAVLSDVDMLSENEEEIDEDFSDLFNDEEPETAEEETDYTIPSIHPVKTTDPKDSEAEAPSEEAVLDPIIQEEDEEITPDISAVESPEPESTAVEPEDEEDGEEMPVAAGLEEEATVQGTQETAVEEETIQEQDAETGNGNSEAEAIADQETLKEDPEEATEKTFAEEAEETTAEEEPAQEQEEEKSDDDLWAEAFADQEALKEEPEEEAAQEASAEEAEETTAEEEPAQEQEEEKSDDDLWAEAFADQEALKEEPEEEAAQEASAEEAEEATAVEEPAQEQEEEKSDDDLWAEAFADQEALKEEPEEAAQEASAEEAEETTAEEEPAQELEEDITADLEEDSEEESELEGEADPEEEAAEDENEIPQLQYEDDYDEKEAVGTEEEPYEDYGDDEEEYEPPSEKKSGFFSMPSTLTGKLILGGGVLAVLLTGGGVYFALQTLAPPELVQMGKNKSQVPEALKPQQVAGTPSLQNETAPLNPPQPASPPAPKEDFGDTADIAKELGQTDNRLEVSKNLEVSEGLLAGLNPSNHAVELSAILPVAYNVNDIRVLSFSLEAEMSDADSAQVVREALPVFERITLTTVEQLLEKKFFNDILYVQEKLKKNLQTNFNKTLEGSGRVKKINFKEFTIQ